MRGDTDPEATEVLRARLRATSPSERVAEGEVVASVAALAHGRSGSTQGFDLVARLTPGHFP